MIITEVNLQDEKAFIALFHVHCIKIYKAFLQQQDDQSLLENFKNLNSNLPFKWLKEPYSINDKRYSRKTIFDLISGMDDDVLRQPAYQTMSNIFSIASKVFIVAEMKEDKPEIILMYIEKEKTPSVSLEFDFLPLADTKTSLSALKSLIGQQEASRLNTYEHIFFRTFSPEIIKEMVNWNSFIKTGTDFCYVLNHKKAWNTIFRLDTKKAKTSELNPEED